MNATAESFAKSGRIALSAITPSKTNPRKSFPKGPLDELADSIKRHDVLQPILVRPNGGAGKYELVAGERRFRAAKMAGLVDIPATERELSDAEVLEIQVVENLQRADLHELEEAEGYEQLLKCSHADGTKYTVDEIVAKVGKSRSYVYQRMKLTSLCPEAREAFYAGKLDGSKALLVARIGHHDTQRQALKVVQGGRRYDGDPMSYREAHQYILQNFMLVLKEAPFDIKDAALVSKAGACGPCPKRTGNNADLFGDVKSADVCTDPKCFDDKRQAHYAVAAKALEAQGKKVLRGDAAKKALPHWDSSSSYSRDQLSGGYMKLDEHSYASGRSRKVSDLLGPEYEPILVQHPLTGDIIKVATQQAVAAAAQKDSKQRSTSKKGAGKKSSAAAKPDEAEILRKRLFRHVCAVLPKKLGAEELRWIAEEVMYGDVDFELIEELFLPPTKAKKSHGAAQARIRQVLPKLDVDGLSRLIVALYLSSDGGYGNANERLETAGKLYGVDLAGVKAAVKAEAKGAEDAKPAVKTKKAAKK